MRYHNRRSMEWRPHPFGDKVGCGTRIEHPMNKRSNITIEIVKMVALARGGGALLGTAKGWFLEFRLIPVLLWSYTAVILGTAVAIVDIGGFDATWFAVALALGGLIQGWETHAINEIYDWRSGTDQVDGARALSGGSRVRNFGLLDERGLWLIFAVSSAAIAALTAWVVVARAPWLAILILIGYALGIAYTVPPVDRLSALRRRVARRFPGRPPIRTWSIRDPDTVPRPRSDRRPVRPRARLHGDVDDAPLPRCTDGRGRGASQADHGGRHRISQLKAL